MSWENDEFVAEVPLAAPPPPPPALSSAERRAKQEQKARELSKIRKFMNRERAISNTVEKIREKRSPPKEPTVLDLHDRELDALPIDDPKYATAEYLILRGNMIHTLDASALPPNLLVLDMRNNGLKEVTGTFPESLRYLYLSSNRLRKAPENLPAGLAQMSIYDNPIKKESALGDLIDATEPRTIYWITMETEASKISEEDVAEMTIVTYPDGVFYKICEDTKSFLRRSICRDQISDEYIDSHLLRTRHLILEIERNEIVGMAIFDLHPTTIFVHLLCASARAPGGGTRMMKMLKNYLQHHDTLTTIRLESVTGAKAFYSKIGFTPCFDGHLCPMEYHRSRLSPRRASGSRKAATAAAAANSKTRKTKAKTKPKTD